MYTSLAVGTVVYSVATSEDGLQSKRRNDARLVLFLNYEANVFDSANVQTSLVFLESVSM